MTQRNLKEYLTRIHRAQDYIERNLGQDLQLETIAREGCFSPFHFHRIFSAITGETLYQFILRLRLERAAAQLIQSSARNITEIALELGFGSSSTFARAFQAGFGMSATEFRKKCKLDRKNRQEPTEDWIYRGCEALLTASIRNPMMSPQVVTPRSTRVEDLAAHRLAYLRHIGPYAGDSNLFEGLWDQFFQWAGPRGLLQRPGAERVCIYHDNPEITEEEKLRISLGVTVGPELVADPPFNTLEIPAGKCVVAHFEIDPSDYGGAWAYVMGEWMPSSGYQLDDRPCYECYLNDPKQHPEDKHSFEIRAPVKPL